MNIENTIAEISSLPIAERLRVVQAVWDSLPLDASFDLTPDQRNELSRRVAAHEEDPSTALTREELERRLRND